jgi:hypothetical protein
MEKNGSSEKKNFNGPFDGEREVFALYAGDEIIFSDFADDERFFEDGVREGLRKHLPGKGGTYSNLATHFAV